MNDEGNIWKTRFFKYGTIVLGIVLFGVFVFVFDYLNQAFVTLMVTAFLTFILAKPVEWMEKKGISRTLGTPVAITLAIVIAVACCIVFIPPIVEQTGRLIRTMPEYIKMLQTKILPKFPELQSLLSEENIKSLTVSAEEFLNKNGTDVAGAALSTVVKIAGGFGYFFGIAMVAMILTMTLLTDLPQLAEDFMSIFNEKNQKWIKLVGKAVGESFYGWLAMMTICGFVFGVVSYFILDFIGVPYAALIGLLCFICFFVPQVGPILAALGAGLAGLCTSWGMAGIGFAVTFLVSMVVQSTLQPNLTMSRLRVNPGFAMFAGMVGGIVGGPIGVLIGVPVYAALQAVFVEYCAVYKGKDLAHAKSRLFIKPDPPEKKGFVIELPWQNDRNQSSAKNTDQKESDPKDTDQK